MSDDIIKQAEDVPCCHHIISAREATITKLRTALETIRDKCPHFHCMAKKYRDVIEEALK